MIQFVCYFCSGGVRGEFGAIKQPAFGAWTLPAKDLQRYSTPRARLGDCISWRWHVKKRSSGVVSLVYTIFNVRPTTRL